MQARADSTSSGMGKVAVFGSGSFGTAMATLVARNGYDVVILTRRAEVCSSINMEHRNPTHLSEFVLPKNIRATLDPSEALTEAVAVVHAIPLQSSEEFLFQVKEHLEPGTLFVSTSKGLHADTLELMHQILRRVVPNQKLAFFSGPTFASQLVSGVPSGAVIAAETLGEAKQAAFLFASSVLRVYPTTDIIGVEVGGALKNVIAILAGGLEGMGYGANALVLLVTRGCREMTRLGVAMGAREHTLTGLAGIGDLMLTCLGSESRNKAVGREIGRGRHIKEVLLERAETLQGVAEGIATAPAAARLAERHGVSAPILVTAAECLEGKWTAKEALSRCMSLPVNPDAPCETRFASGVDCGCADEKVRRHIRRWVVRTTTHFLAALTTALVVHGAASRQRVP